MQHYQNCFIPGRIDDCDAFKSHVEVAIDRSENSPEYHAVLKFDSHLKRASLEKLCEEQKKITLPRN